ncbi:MAG TPA: fibronectin type III domain-containing protein [Verrucomicrobiae bacterium]
MQASSFAAEIHLSWDANPEPDIAGYKVYARNLTASSTSVFDVGNETSASFAATDGVSYLFSVTAYNLAGLESAPSTEVRYDAPADQLTVSWDRSIYSSVAQYRLSYAPLNQTAQQLVAGLNTSISLSGLQRGSNYYFYVEAFDSMGRKLDSWQQVSALMPLQGLLGSVHVPRANLAPQIALNSPIAGANYTAPATINLTATASDLDGTIRSVDFYRGSTRLYSDTVAPYAYTWTGVAAGSYQVSAIAIDSQGASTRSAIITVNVNAPLPSAPPAPMNITASGVGGSIVVGWSASTGATSYFVERSTSSAGAYTRLGTTQTTQWTDSTVAAGTTYFYRVIASSNGVLSLPSASVSATLQSAPAAPAYLTAVGGKAQINLTWRDMSTNESSFIVTRSMDGVVFSEVAILNANSTSYRDTSIAPRTRYYYTVAAANSAGKSFSGTVTAKAR